MANSLSPLVQSQYTKTVQALLEERLIAMDIAQMRDISNGNTLNNPRGVYLNVDSYTKYTDVSDQDITYSNEQLVVNQIPLISFVYDPVDETESGYDVVAIEAPKAAYRIKQDIEGNFFNEYSNAGNASASTITLTTGASQNTTTTYGNAYATLINDGVDSENIVAVVDPYQLQTIGTASLGNTFKVADESFRRGYKWEFQGMYLYQSTNLTATATLAFGTEPTADDTVTINGVTFTFVAAPANPGEVDLSWTAATTLDNLVAAINGTGTPGATTYIELSAANRAKMEGITATDGTTTMALESKRGYKVLSTSLTAAGDKWGAVTIHNLIMERGAIDVAIQKEVNLKTQDIHKQLGTRYMTWGKYWIKTFTEGAEKMYDLKIQAQAAE